MTTPEQQARIEVDQLLEKAGWKVFDYKSASIYAGRGVAIREFPLKTGYGTVDYLLYVDAKAAGVIEAKKTGSTLTGVEVQSKKYSEGLPDELPAWCRPLPFNYESTGIETRFTNALDPDARSRRVFAFHRPETLAKILGKLVLTTPDRVREDVIPYGKPLTLRARLRLMPDLIEEGLWPAQIKAITNLEDSLAQNRPRALVQMATGSGKTFTAVSSVYRFLKFAEARRILFLVDRGNLGRQTLKEFQQYQSPYNNWKFSEEFIVQHLKSNVIDDTARVCISTIQRMYSMLKGEELDPENEEESLYDHSPLMREPLPVEYNPDIPPETFDIVIIDECHRSIYGLWRQVLEYFDAFLIGLTATPNKQTFGFFKRNLVMEYGHEQAVADGVNVNYDVFRIRTKITAQGSTVEAGYQVGKRNRETREVRWERLDEDLSYEASSLDRDVVAPDQIRTVIKAFRDNLFTNIFPGRTVVPKTLVFAKDDSHAEEIVKLVREEFAKGNDFCQKITYRTTGDTPENLIKQFRTSYNPRIAVTVDMIATGTDIKPVEIVFFMRTVKSRSYFEQMKGRGVRVIPTNDLLQVTSDAVRGKQTFVIVDAVGVCENDKTDSYPMERKRTLPLEKLLQSAAFGNTDPDVISSIAVRLSRLEKNLDEGELAQIEEATGGITLKELAGDLVNSLIPDRHIELAKREAGLDEPPPEAVKNAANRIIADAARPIADPRVRDLILNLKKKSEQTIDEVSEDEVLEAGFDARALERAKATVQDFEAFIKEHKDEITALQLIYSRPYRESLKLEDVKDLAARIDRPPHLLNADKLWDAYAALEKSRVRGAGAHKVLADLVSLVRFALEQERVLEPFGEHVKERFASWLTEQESGGRKFNPEQLEWLEMIRDHVAASLTIELDDFNYAPFSQAGGLGKIHELFGEEFGTLIDELNGVLAA